MANAVIEQMADDIASLVRKQTFAGSGVWRQSGNATLRIETQTDSIVEALQRLPSVETQEEEERESDRQHEELIDAIEGTAAQTTGTTEKKGGGLFGNLFKGLGGLGLVGLGASLKGLFNFLKPIALIFAPLKFLMKPIEWLIGGKDGKLGKGITKFLKPLFFGLGGLAAVIGGLAIATILGFDPENEEEAQKYFKKSATNYKENISFFTGQLISGLINGAIILWNSLLPGEKFDVTDKNRKKLTDSTLKTVTDTVLSIVNFFDDIATNFGAGFLDATKEKKGPGGEVIQESLKTKFNNFTEAFSNFGESISNLGKALGKMFENFEVKVDGVTYKGLMGENSLSTLMGYLTGKLAGGILDFSTAVLNFLADPSKGIEKIIDDFLFNLSELFSKASLVRMAESYGLGSLVSKEFRQEAANEQIIRALKAGRDIKPSDTVERVFDAEDYGPMSAPNLAKSFNESFLGKGIDNFFINAFKSANEGLRMLILPDNLLNEIKGSRQTGGKISETGLYKLHAGEIVFDPPSSDRIDNFVASYLPQSGATINGLQMDRMIGGTTGSAAPVVIDNSQQPTIINQTNVAAPQTRGPALVGEGRDKVNMR